MLLVQEDDSEWRELLRETLRTWDYEASFAGSYPEGLAKARQVEPRVVIVEVDRLEGGSVQFATDLRRVLPETSIALITASRVSAASLRLRAAGLAEVFVRPLQLSALEQWLDEELASH